MADEQATILVVEDDVLVLATLSKMLRRAGYTVIGATSGKEAIRLHHRFNSTIDMVLVDYFLPDLTGLEVAQELQKDYPSCKVLGMSGMLTTEQRFQSLGLQFILKPFGEGELLSRISAYVALR